MSAKNETIDGSERPFETLADVATEWTSDTCDDMTTLTIICDAKHKPFARTVKYDDNDGNEQIREKPYIYASDGQHTLPIRLNKFSQQNLGQVLGMAVAKWHNKKVTAIHQVIGNTKFLTLKAKK